MAFPVVSAKGTVYNTGGTATTSHALPLPSGIASGHLLLAFFAVRGQVTSSWPAGWTELGDAGLGGSTLGNAASMAYRIADGSEGSTVTVTSSASREAVGYTWRVTGWHGATAPELASATGTSATPSPPSLDPAGWGTEDTLWIAFISTDDDQVVTAYPANYTNDQQANSTGGGFVAAAICSRNLTAASDDPGTFTAPVSDNWVAFTVAVRPAAATSSSARRQRQRSREPRLRPRRTSRHQIPYGKTAVPVRSLPPLPATRLPAQRTLRRAFVDRRRLPPGLGAAGGPVVDCKRRSAANAGMWWAYPWLPAPAAGVSTEDRRQLVGRYCANLLTAVGFRVSPDISLPAGLISNSRISWQATLNGGQVTVETSTDLGATWELATNGGRVPQLVTGKTAPATLRTRVTLSRTLGTDPSPLFHRLDVAVSVANVTDELVPQGVFTLAEVDINDSASGLTVDVTGFDLSRTVARNRWEDTYTIAVGTNYATAIRELVLDRLPSALFNFATTTATTPLVVLGEQSGNDPWADATKLAEAVGMELFFDVFGVCTLRAEPNPDLDLVVWEFSDTSHPVMVEASKRLTDEFTYNKVVVTGEGPENAAPVRAVAVDDDPASPTYILGPYGPVTFFFHSPLVTTADQAQEAADSTLRRVKGASESVELTVVPMPALEPGDVITVKRGRSKIDSRYVIDSTRTPLSQTDAQRLGMRRRRFG